MHLNSPPRGHRLVLDQYLFTNDENLSDVIDISKVTAQKPKTNNILSDKSSKILL